MRTKTLPGLTKEPVLHVDATPDEDYPLRILRAHRANCDARWEVHGLSEAERRIYDLMNEHCAQRAEILDRAIARLTGSPPSGPDAAERPDGVRP